MLPVWLTVYINFSYKIIKWLLINLDHLRKTVRSYRTLCKELLQEWTMNAAASMHLQIPILMVKGKQLKSQRTHKVYYEFYREFCLEQDQPRSLHDFQIRMAFNGVTHYTCFFRTNLAKLINDGKPLMYAIHKANKLKRILPKLPEDSVLQGALEQMLIHLCVADAIADTISFQVVKVTCILLCIFQYQSQYKKYIKIWHNFILEDGNVIQVRHS